MFLNKQWQRVRERSGFQLDAGAKPRLYELLYRSDLAGVIPAPAKDALYALAILEPGHFVQGCAAEQAHLDSVEALQKRQQVVAEVEEQDKGDDDKRGDDSSKEDDKEEKLETFFSFGVEDSLHPYARACHSANSWFFVDPEAQGASVTMSSTLNPMLMKQVKAMVGQVVRALRDAGVIPKLLKALKLLLDQSSGEGAFWGEKKGGDAAAVADRIWGDDDNSEQERSGQASKEDDDEGAVADEQKQQGSGDNTAEAEEEEESLSSFRISEHVLPVVAMLAMMLRKDHFNANDPLPPGLRPAKSTAQRKALTESVMPLARCLVELQQPQTLAREFNAISMSILTVLTTLVKVPALSSAVLIASGDTLRHWLNSDLLRPRKTKGHDPALDVSSLWEMEMRLDLDVPALQTRTVMLLGYLVRAAAAEEAAAGEGEEEEDNSHSSHSSIEAVTRSREAWGFLSMYTGSRDGDSIEIAQALLARMREEQCEPSAPSICASTWCCRVAATALTRLRRCGRCKKQWYCDRNCQLQAWKEQGHKANCVACTPTK